MTLVQPGKNFDIAKSFDRAMQERAKDGHNFKSMDIKGMENICDICYMAHKGESK